MIESIVCVGNCTAICIGMGIERTTCVVGKIFLGAIGVVDRGGLTEDVVGFCCGVAFGIVFLDQIAKEVVCFVFSGSVWVLDRGNSSNGIVSEMG